MSKLQGKVAVVTGGSKGIGAAIAKALAGAGAAVVVNYASSKDAADAVVAGIEQEGGRAIAVHADVTKEDQAKALITSAVEKFGGLDILVNNSGVYGFAPIEEVTEEQYRWMFDINVLGLLFTTREAGPHLRDGGAVINISSVVTSVAVPGSSVYSASKGAVDAITSVLAKELAPRRIRVNAINPGYVETEGTHATGITGSEAEAGFIADTPLGRGGRPDDIADVALFLASEDARWITGEKIAASGGLR